MELIINDHFFFAKVQMNCSPVSISGNEYEKKNPWSHRFYDFKQMWSSENDFSDYKLRLLLE